MVAIVVQITLGESAIDKLKAKIEAGTAAKPCDKNVPKSAPPHKQFLDHRLPVIVDDYHPPFGGFDPTHIPNHEVDVAARRVLREIQLYQQEQREMGTLPPAPSANAIMTTEEHKAMKQLLLDADILVRHAAKSLAENGPIDASRVAKSAILNAADLERKWRHPQPQPFVQNPNDPNLRRDHRGNNNNHKSKTSSSKPHRK